VQFLLEGQEEIGSPHLAAFLEREAGRLAADVALSADGAQISISQPGLVLGLRGAAAFQVDVQTLAGDVHSGASLYIVLAITNTQHTYSKKA
jgi:acetylornithine deacetylase/succinyl-diaminopimelate desuccinylase-like protein